MATSSPTLISFNSEWRQTLISAIKPTTLILAVNYGSIILLAEVKKPLIRLEPGATATATATPTPFIAVPIVIPIVVLLPALLAADNSESLRRKLKGMKLAAEVEGNE